MKIKIYQMDKEFKAMGAYAIGSIKDGVGEIMVDFEGVECADCLPDDAKKHVLKETIMHELDHAVSDYFGLPMEDPDGLCGGTERQEMVVVPLEEHENVVKQKDKEIRELTETIEIISKIMDNKKDNVCGSWSGGTDACDDMKELAEKCLKNIRIGE